MPIVVTVPTTTPATTGTTGFAMDFTDIAEEAYERAGKEMRSGYDLRTARRSLNLLTIEWANKGLNLWTLDEGFINLVAGTATYDLPADTVDLLEHAIRTGDGSQSAQSDIVVQRISVSTYAAIPNKLTQGRPVQVFIQRLRDNPKVTVWPVPADGTYQLRYWRMRRIQDAGSGVETADIVFRFQPAVVAGLAYYLAMKDPKLADRLPMLQAEYDRQYDLAAQEDREKASVRFVPRRMRL